MWRRIFDVSRYATNKLSDRGLRSLNEPGRYADGGGLYVQVQPGGSKTFVFLTQSRGSRQLAGLGSYPAIPLATARERAELIRTAQQDGRLIELIRSGYSFSDACNRLLSGLRAGRKIKAEPEDRKVPVFADFAKDWMDRNLVRLSNDKARAQWYSTLQTYARPIARKRLDTIGTDDILKCLRPIWTEKPETARRVQQRIERILSAADVLGYRSGKNPAQWRGHLDQVLPVMPKFKQHHPAMPYSDVPAYMSVLRERPSMASLCLQFIILTAARSGEARGARWNEFDAAKTVWTVPKERMKARRPHQVPLSAATKAILVELDPGTNSGDAFVFLSDSKAGHLSEAAIRQLMSKTGASDATIHGFRSAFRDWAGNATEFPRDLAEEALAHQLGAVEAAYRREQAVERRRVMMEAWATTLDRRRE
jgi:integrase